MIPTPEINQSSWVGRDTASVLSVCHYALSWPDTVCQGFIATPESFSSSYGEKHPDPKSGQDIDPDKAGQTTSCQGEKERLKCWANFCPSFFPDL